MLFRLVRPMRRKGSRVPYFVQRIPADLKSRVDGLALAIPLGGTTRHMTLRAGANDIRFSLRTNDPYEVKQRQAAAAAYLETVWRALREDAPQVLSHRQATALAGELYRAWANEQDRERTLAMEHSLDGGWQLTSVSDDEEIAIWEAAGAHLNAVKAEADASEPDLSALERRFGPIVDRLLLARGISRVDVPSRARLLSAFWLALKDAFDLRANRSRGDYSRDPKAERFPEWTPVRSTISLSKKVSLIGLVEAWWQEAQATGRKPSTYESYRRTVANLAEFLGHDDATRVTPADVAAFKSYRLSTTNPRDGKRVSPRTVKDTDLAGLKSVFGWAVTNSKLPSNPAKRVSISLGKRRSMRRGFNDAEAVAILRAVSSVERGGERPETYAAKRWVPWLLAYTGARVGEMAQLRKEDVRQQGKHWVATITPDAGTVKTDEARHVVLHPHLVELGFIDFVKGARSGHLFLRPSAKGGVLGPLQGVKNRLAEFVRAVVPDKKVDPNHGWRHRFKTVCREVGVDTEVRDYIQGHAPKTVAEQYGEVSVKAQAAAIAMLPRYEV
jgi:integrase